MVDVDFKALVGRLNHTCNRAMEAAAGACVARTNYEVTVEHVMSVLVEDPTNDLAAIFQHHGIDAGRIQKALSGVVERLKTGNAGRPVFSPILMDWIQQAWLLASVDHGLAQIRSGVLLRALLSKPGRFCGDDYESLFEAIGAEALKNEFADVVAVSSEEAQVEAAGATPGAAPPAEGDALAKFTINFTERARSGELDPVFGRDREIRQMVDILARRRKNNPIAVGEAGVGKTALIEGLALRIVEGDVPDILREVDLVGLDLGLLQAGASVKGEFENRLKQVIEEVKASPKPIVLFIDEAHTLIGAGGAAGTGDAANLLKPALARGELRTVAATTWSEYKKYFEKDPALARRFQLVKVEEPDDEGAATMLRGLKSRYEEAHGVVIRDEAITSAAQLGSRYIAGRQHPDKGVDLLDTAAARVKIALSSKPGDVEDLERKIQALERELKAQERDAGHGVEGCDERIAELKDTITASQDELDELRGRWEKERDAVHRVIAARKAAAEGDEDGAADLEPARVALAEVQGKHPLVHSDVTSEVMTQVIADWTGIPIGKMVQDEAGTLLEFEDNMKSRVKGQDHVMDIVGEGVRAAKAGLKSPSVPMGIFLFVGPSGVGKTETALGVADLMFGGERFMTTINMSEFQEKHSVSRLIGSPPGYVGYGEGGILTEAVRQRPYSVVLLDEVEKADLEVMNLFYQVFDKGTLSDSEGRVVDFKDTVIFLTSNLATDLITDACAEGRPDIDDLVSLIRPTLSAHFKPALLARMTVVPFFTLDPDSLKMITRLKLGALQKRLMNRHRMKMEISDTVVDAIAERCTEVETGARNVDHIITGTLLPRISTEILQQMTVGPLPDQLDVGLDDAGEFTFAFSGN